jgi:hypothetical protein
MNIANEIVVVDVVDGLNELCSRDLQERLWLSDGSSGEVSSFEEAICSIFDDGGVTRALESGRLPSDLGKKFGELNKLIDKIPNNVHPSVIINHPAMEKIRTIAETILEEIKMA